MEFGLSEIQLALQENLNKFLDEKCDLEVIRRSAEDSGEISQELWRGLADLGVAGTIVPEEYNGVGLGILDAVVISECIGSHVAPVPFVSTAVLTPLAILKAGSEEQKSEFLAEIASGAIRFGLAISELSGARGESGVDARGDKLSGKAHFVTDPDADYFLVSSKSRSLHIVPKDATGLSSVLMPNIDRTRSLAALTFDSVVSQTLPGSTNNGIANELMQVARVVLAADTLGASQAMLDQAVAYAKQREQFNRIIASFQAVKHMCAEMAAEIEPARSLVWYAGHALDEMPEESHLTACHAKAHLSEVGTFVARTSTIVHGGMGFTDLLGLHYWFKRIGFNRQMFGGPERVREEAAQIQGLI